MERAYGQASEAGLLLWCQDEAGPYTTAPYQGEQWDTAGTPSRQSHEYLPEGTAKLWPLLHPASGQVSVKGVTSSTNTVLHSWVQAELTALGATTTAGDMRPRAAKRAAWEEWQAGLTMRPTLPAELPPVRMLLLGDNEAGHPTPDMGVWLFRHGIMPLSTPLGGSWLNMAEWIQHIVEAARIERATSNDADRD